MQQAEIVELFGPMLKQGAQRRKVTDFSGLILLLIVSLWWGYSAWRNNQVPKIESIALVPNSVVIIGPADRVAPNGELAFCPGDMMTVRYQLDIEGEGVIYADDAAHLRSQTVKFSTVWRDIVEPGIRTYDNEWQIPPRPDMAIDGDRRWLPGEYTRVISVAASNIYASRYVPPATFEVDLRIPEGCP